MSCSTQRIKPLRWAIVLLFAPSLLLSQPAQDAVYQRLVHEYTLHLDGSVEYHHFRQLKIESYYAFHRGFGETFIVYNPDIERLSIKEAFTIMADGKRINLPDNALNEVLPRYADGAPPYNALREMVVTHTGLERGSTIYLDYTVKRFPGLMTHLSGAMVLAEDVPVKELTFILRAPDGVIIHHKLLNLEAEPEVVHRDGMTEYRWQLKEIPALINPPLAVSAFYRAPAIIYSTARDMETVWNTFVGQAAFRFEANTDMMLLADSLQKQSKDELGLALSIQEFIHTSTKTWQIPLADIGFKVREAGMVWNSAGGTPMEKAVLFVALAKASGIKAQVVAKVERVLFDKGIGLPQAFCQPLVRIHTRNRTLFLDPIAKSTFSEDLAVVNYYLVPLEPGSRMLEQPGPDLTASLNLKANLRFEPATGVRGDVSLTAAHAACPELLLHAGKDAWEAFGKMKGYTSSQSSPAGKGSKPCEVSFQVAQQGESRAHNHVLYVTWPHPDKAMQKILGQSLTQSEDAATLLPHGLSLEYNYELVIPSGYRLVARDMNEEIKSEAGSFRASLRQQRDKIVYSRALKLESVIPKDRSGFTDLINIWLSPSWESVYITRD